MNNFAVSLTANEKVVAVSGSQNGGGSSCTGVVARLRGATNNLYPENYACRRSEPACQRIVI
jgi:hypothetical protein